MTISSLLLPHLGLAQSRVSQEAIDWQPLTEQAISQVLAENKRIFISGPVGMVSVVSLLRMLRINMTIPLCSKSDDELTSGLWRKGYHFPVVNDLLGMISQHFQISVTPTLLVIYQGRIISCTSGWTSYWGIELRS